ncbi:MAG: NAD-dependent epimerase/dehydratase family protein [Clostridium sp.]
MLNILILGGNGFVSKALAKHLIKQGYIVDILTNNDEPIDYIGFREHIICDRNYLTDLRKVIEPNAYDIILDITGYTKNHIKNIISCININNLKRYIFCSSASVYLDSKDELTEDSQTCNNSSIYNKYEAENYIFNLIDKRNLHATIFRPSYIYGEENNHYRESYFFDRINEDKVIQVPDDTVSVQFIYIQDLVKVLECAIYNDNDKRAYNLTSPNRVSWIEFINTCGKIMNKTPKINLVSTSNSDTTINSFFPFKSINYNLNIKDLRENGFHLPVIYLDEGLKRTYEWYLKEKLKQI